MEKTRSVEEELDANVFISRQSWHISFVIIMNKVVFPTLYLLLACKQFYFTAKKKVYIGELKELKKRDP